MLSLPIDPTGTVWSLFEAAAVRYGERTAVRASGSAWSYRRLRAQAEDIAAVLVAGGTAPGDLIAVRMNRGPELVALLLGVMRCGAGYVPLDPKDPDERVQLILRESSPTLVVDDQAHQDVTLQALMSGSAVVPPAASSDSERPAYVMFTSGSTGIPKGVAMPHRSLVNLLRWHESARPGSCGRTTAQVCATGFDFSFHEIFSTLCGGGALVVASDDVRLSPDLLRDFVRNEGIERLFAPVPLLDQLCRVSDGFDVPTLEEVITTGERLLLTDSLRSFFTGCGALLHNHYGATEFQDATTATLDGDPGDWPSVAPAGRPIDGVRVHIDVDGEVSISGNGLAHGYVNVPGETTRRFVLDPESGERRYRTGDLGSWDSTGNLHLSGRADRQIKIRGIRVDPAEVETALLTFEHVVQAVAQGHEINGATSLVAYLVIDDSVRDERALETVIHRQLGKMLPTHLVPRAYVFLDRIPVTASGKTDREQLQLPTILRRHGTTKVAAPQTKSQYAVLRVVENVLGLDMLSIDDDFFAQGGSSMQLVAVCRILERELGVRTSVAEAMAQPTVRDWARIADEDGYGNNRVIARQRRVSTPRFDGNIADLATVRWEATSSRAADPQADSRRWVVLHGHGGDRTASTLARLLDDRGIAVRRARDSHDPLGDADVVVIVADRGSGSEGIEAVAAWGLQILHRIAALDPPVGEPVVVAAVTSGATTVESSSGSWRMSDAVGASLVGMLNCAAVEIDSVRFATIDIDPASNDTARAAIVLGELCGSMPALSMVRAAHASGVRYVQRIRRLKYPPTVADRENTIDGAALVVLDDDRVVLPLCRSLAERGARRIVLVGCTSASVQTQKIDLLRISYGTRIDVVDVDTADRSAMGSVVESLTDTSPLSVYYLAGVRDGAVIDLESVNSLRATLKGTVGGALVIDEVTREVPLQRFVIFSSAVGVLGAAGQVVSAAANAYLEGIAARRRSEGKPGLAIQWGEWHESEHALDLLLHVDAAAGTASARSMPACVLAVDWMSFAVNPPAAVGDLIAGMSGCLRGLGPRTVRPSQTSEDPPQ